MNSLKKTFKIGNKLMSIISNTIRAAFDPNAILIHWAERDEGKKNFGDDLNPWMIERMTGKKPYNINKMINIKNKPVYSCIGSILSFGAHKNLYVWGSGFISEDAEFKVIPEEIRAVRGPLTREKIINQGFHCPEIYGDPALLLPYLYKPEIKKKYKLGIVPHFVDKKNSNYLNLIKELPDDVLFIDIEDSIENFVDNLLQCEKIASSSLHGLIVADAYNIPSLHIKFSQNVIGGDFKFKDYMLSVKREYEGPVIINESSSIDYILGEFYDYSIDINLNELIEACPFPIQKSSLEEYAKNPY